MNIVLFLGILLLVGLLATRASKRISLPNVTAFLLIGVLIAIICLLIDKSGYKSPDGVKLSESLSTMNSFVSSVALGFIALSIGEEFKLSKIKEYGSKIMIITFLQALLAVAFVDVALLLACYFLKLNMAIAICLGAIATATAPAATLMVIHQYKAQGPLVDILLPVVAFDDAIGLIIFSISLACSRLFLSSGTLNATSMVLVPLLEIFGSLLLGFILGVLLHLTIKFFKSRSNHMTIIIAYTLLGVGATIALNQIKIDGNNLDFSSLLTCMMIGAAYVNLGKDEEKTIIHRDIELMERWTGFLFTLFFVLSGANLIIAGNSIFSSGDTKLLLPIAIVFVIYLLARSGGKYLGAFVGAKITHRSKEITKYLGFTLLPQAGVAIGMANSIGSIEAFKQDNIGNIVITVVLCATLIYEIFGPLLTKWSLLKAGEISRENL